MPLGINLFGKGHTQEAQQERGEGGKSVLEAELLNHQKVQITECTVQNGVKQKAVKLEPRRMFSKTSCFHISKWQD